jgi:hypothetical protein
MLKNNDFRIGNFTYGIEQKPQAIRRVTSINEDNVYLIRIDGLHGDLGYTYDNINPIKLTEEWLIRLGVNEVKSQEVLRINYVKYYKTDNKFDYCLCYYFDDDGYVDNVFKEIKYVHELQNLYFALTGSELQYVA